MTNIAAELYCDPDLTQTVLTVTSPPLNLAQRYARLAATVADFKRKAADGSKFEKEVAALNVAKSFQVRADSRLSRPS